MSRLLRSSLTQNLRRFASTETRRRPDDFAEATRRIFESPETQATLRQGASGQSFAPAPALATESAPAHARAPTQALPRLDPIEDPLLHQFSRLIMRDGKLLTAQKTLQTCLAHLRAATNDEPLPLLRRAVDLASPQIRTVQQKLTATKRATLPLPITEKRRTRTGITWIVDASYKKRAQEKVFGKRLANEVLNVLDGTSEVLKKKDDLHKAATIARANVGKNQAGKR